MSTIFFLDDLGLRDPNRFGEEAAALGDLVKAGIPVAPAFVLSTAAMSEFLQFKPVAQVLSTCNPHQLEEFRRRLLAVPLPAHLEEEIRGFYRRLSGPRDVVVLVRGGDREEKAVGEEETVALVRKLWTDHLGTVCALGSDFNQELLPLLVQQGLAGEFSGSLFTSSAELGNPDLCLVEVDHPRGKERFTFEKGSAEPVKRTVSGLVDNPTAGGELSNFSSLAAKIEQIGAGAFYLTWRGSGKDFAFIRMRKVFLPPKRQTVIKLWLEIGKGEQPELDQGVAGFVFRDVSQSIEAAKHSSSQEVLFFLESPDFEQLERFRSSRNKLGLKNLHLILPPVRTVDGLSEIKRLISGEGIRRGPNLKFFFTLSYPSNVVLLEQFLDLGVDGVIFQEEAMTRGLLGTKETVEPDESLIWALREAGRKCRGKCAFFYLGRRARSWLLFEIVRSGVAGLIIPAAYKPEYTKVLLEAERGSLA